MRSSLTLALSLLAASAVAAPGPKCKKAVTQTCNADNCLRAVRATSAKPFASSGTADCSSFMRKTVTPCAATSTATATVTVTAIPTTVTATEVVAVTQLNTVFQSVPTVVTTIEDTVTFIQPTEVDIINIIVTAVTVTAAPAKRAVDFQPLPANPAITGVAALKPRVIVSNATVTSNAGPGTCPATTNSPTAVPTYASACSGTARYSSACSCAGVTGTTTTLAQSTVTTTSTSTVFVTPTATATAVLTTQVPVTVTQTELVPTAFETTDATLIIQSAFTVTSNIVIPTTVVVAPPAQPTCYNFVVADGARAGQILSGQTPSGGANAVSYGFLYFTQGAGLTFRIHPDGKVYDSTNQYGWTTRNNALYYVLQMNDYSESQYRINYLKCAVGGTAPASVPNAAGMLSCTTDNGNPTFLVSCANQGNNMLQAPNVAGAGNGCSAINFAAVPVLC